MTPARKVLAEADQGNAAVGIVLGLPQKIAGHQRRIGEIVGDNHNLGRPRQQVNAASAVKLPLRFRHELVPCPAKHIDRLKDSHAKSHQGKSGDSTQDEDAVGSCLLHGIHGRREKSLSLHRWGKRVHVFHPGHLGGNNAHLRRPEHGIAPARNVDAHRFNGHVLVPQNDARARFHFEWEQCAHLRLCERAHVGLAEVRVFNDPRIDGGDDLIRLRRTQFKVGGTPVVELFAVFAHRVHAASFQIRQHLRHDFRTFVITLKQPMSTFFEDSRKVPPSICMGRSSVALFVGRFRPFFSKPTVGSLTRPRKTTGCSNVLTCYGALPSSRGILRASRFEKFF